MDSAMKFKDVEHYLENQPEEIRKRLDQVRKTIRKAAPQAEELISYNMPAYKQDGMLVYFAGFKNHYSLFAMPTTQQVFKEKLKKYKISKGTIQFKLEEEVPVKLITEIVKFRLKENKIKASEKQALKSVKKKPLKKSAK
jgi:uncharacterized protein YdhG (YjbR/CyaY superfamily)